MTAVVRGDALNIPLRDKSVNLIVTSPPYFALRSYRDDGEHYDGQIGSEPTPQAFLEALWAVTKECWRVLADDGVMFVNLGDKRVSDNRGSGSDVKRGQAKHAPRGPAGYARGFGRPKSKMALPHRYFIGCMDGLADPDGIGWIARQDIVWSKPNGLPESVTDRVRDSHEYWFMLTKQERYFAAVDEVRESYAPGTAERYAAGFTQIETSAGGHTKNGVLRADNGGPSSTNPLGKLPGSVWTIASEPLVVPEWLGVDHFAAFPQEWPRRLILGWSPSGICTACGEGRRPVKDVDWSKVPHQMVEKRALTAHETSAWTGEFAAWCSSNGITARLLDETCGTNGMGGHWTTTRVQALVPTIEQWAKIVDRFGPVPDSLSELVHLTRLMPVAEWEKPNFDVAGQHQTKKGATLSTGDYSSITGYACACPTPNAPTRPSVVLDVFGGTGTTAMVARALGRTGISLDLSQDYCRLAAWRIFESGHAAKARDRTNRENQGSLL